MTIIIVIMIRLLSGTVVIKMQGPESTNEKIINAHCLASITMVGLMHARRR